MVKPELGTKRVCVACGTKFYDLTRTPAVCPKCGTEQPAEQPRLRRPAAPVDEKLRKRAVRDWSVAKAKAFLGALAETCNVSEACRTSGVPMKPDAPATRIESGCSAVSAMAATLLTST